MVSRIIQLLWVALVIITVVGCQNDTVLDPSASMSSDQVSPAFRPAVIRNPIVTIPLAPDPVTERDIQLVPMPTPAIRIPHLPKLQLISADSGGVIICQDQYIDILGDTVQRYARLYIPPQALDIDVEITMELDTASLGILFEPSGIYFNKPLMLSFIVKGLADLSTIGPLKFYYVNDNNATFEIVDGDSLVIDALKTSIDLQNARIHHFSRYGFGR